MFATAEVFVEVWELSLSSEEVSYCLVALGHRHMTPPVVKRWAKTMREVGVRLKKMPPPASSYNSSQTNN